MPETIYVFIQACWQKDYDKIKEILEGEQNQVVIDHLYRGYRAGKALDELASVLHERKP